MTRLWTALFTLGVASGCAASTDEEDSRPHTASSGGSTVASGGSSAGTAGTIATGGGGSGAGTAGTTVGGSPPIGGSAGTSSNAGTGGSGTAGGAAVPAGQAVVTIASFSLVGCTESTSVTELEAKSDGLTAPEPMQSYEAGTMTVEFTVSGQYGEIGVDFPTADMTGCGISVALSASSWPACGIYAVPFFYDGVAGLIAPYDAPSARFVGEEISNISGPATIVFQPTGAPLTKVGRIGLNIYNCPDSVTVGDL